MKLACLIAALWVAPATVDAELGQLPKWAEQRMEPMRIRLLVALEEEGLQDCLEAFKALREMMIFYNRNHQFLDRFQQRELQIEIAEIDAIVAVECSN